METFTDFFQDLLVIALLLLAAMALTPAVRAIKLPPPAAFLAVGIVAGYYGAGSLDRLAELPLEEIGAVALYGILFQGGLATGFRAWRREAAPILALGTVGTAVTAISVAAFAHYAIDLSWALAALVGVALSPTDPAAVYSMLRGGRASPRARVILEGESGFNDPVSISLMVAVVAVLATEDATAVDGLVRFVEELSIGLVGGAVGAVVLITLLRATPRLEEGLQAVAVLVTVAAVGAATASLHGSGFLAVYVSGLLISDVWAAQDGRHHAIPEAFAAAAEPILFGLLGAVFVSRASGLDIAYGLLLTIVTILLVRPAVVFACLARSRLGPRERLVVSAGGLKGAVPLLLAGYAGLEGLSEASRTESIVLCATAASIVLQGWALFLIVTRVGRGAPRSAG
jgi:potassium/hydrogen antiporter